MAKKAKWIVRIVLLAAAGGFIAHGILRGEMAMVLTKAVNICMECVGLG